MESLTVDGILESLEAIADYVMTAARQVSLEKKKAYKLRLAVDELTTNIILYGYQKNELQGTIKLQAEIGDGSLKIIIEDQSPAFDPQQNLPIATQVLDKPLEDRPIGGLGIYLAIEGVDEFSYERDENHRLNRTTLVVNQSPS